MTHRRPSLDQLVAILLCLLALSFVLLLWLLWREYRAMAAIPPGSRMEWMGAGRQGSVHAPNATPDVLRPWMTFEYVNRIFGLSPEILRDALGITDKRYPKLSIAAYARRIGRSSDAIIAQISLVITAAQLRE